MLTLPVSAFKHISMAYYLIVPLVNLSINPQEEKRSRKRQRNGKTQLKRGY